MRLYEDIGVLVPEVYLPKTGVDPRQWAVIAVDQFTSEPEYWEQVEDVVGEAPSTLRMVLPEIYLGQADEADRIRSIRNTMRQYLRAGILKSREGLILVERTMQRQTRRGLMLCLDLERYDFAKASTSLIRASEETIVERLPPRMKIREGAPLELPHIVVLIDDPHRTVIEPLIAVKKKLEKLYEFDLMLGSGHIAGYGVQDESSIIAALRELAKADPQAPLFAVGDGNHSLATAKSVWEKMKPEVGMNHPARFALVEIENIHDEALKFEPIHRVLFGVKEDFASNLPFRVTPQGPQCFRIAETGASLGDIQAFLDRFLKSGGAESIDYVHGEDAAMQLGSQPGNIALCFPSMDKSDLFKTITLNGALPRKTFSMGEALGKRFYMELRKI